MKNTSYIFSLFFLVLVLGLINIFNVNASNNEAQYKELIHVISPLELKQMFDTDDVELIDVRNTDEFVARHIKWAKNIPLSILDLDQICNKTKNIVLQCESGIRSNLAAKKLKTLYPDLKIYSLDGGIKNWIKANYSIVEGKARNTMPIIRQVQIAAGSIIILGIVLTLVISRLFIIVPLFVGCGLIFAGLSGWCGMALLLSLMPWN